jgi:hypothetical protein
MQLASYEAKHLYIELSYWYHDTIHDDMPNDGVGGHLDWWIWYHGVIRSVTVFQSTLRYHRMCSVRNSRIENKLEYIYRDTESNVDKETEFHILFSRTLHLTCALRSIKHTKCISGQRTLRYFIHAKYKSKCTRRSNWSIRCKRNE